MDLVDTSRQESFGQFLMPMWAVYGEGSGQEYDIRFALPEFAPPGVAWAVRDDGSIASVGRTELPHHAP